MTKWKNNYNRLSYLCNVTFICIYLFARIIPLSSICRVYVYRTKSSNFYWPDFLRKEFRAKEQIMHKNGKRKRRIRTCLPRDTLFSSEIAIGWYVSSMFAMWVLDWKLNKIETNVLSQIKSYCKRYKNSSFRSWLKFVQTDNAPTWLPFSNATWSRYPVGYTLCKYEYESTAQYRS